ncbi:MAG: GAF domain-containing protein [Deltaproteobacteria bacterium]|nr:GAF domain-containing protein [Deltaproteobacteria bacterium]
MALDTKQQVGFAIDELLYEGSRTKVLRGRRLDDGRSVILKILVNDPPSPTELARFRLEHTLSSEFQSPHIARPLDLLLWDGQWTIVFEDIGGRSLDTIVKDTKGQWQSFIPIALKMTEALAVVHEYGVIHKDICPANIIATPDLGQIQIIDFGIATKLSRETTTADSIDTIEGTLSYIAPEQTGRMNRPVDLRSDLYALGVTFYQLLTGSLPFTSTDPVELIHSHIARAAPSPADLYPNLPPLLCRILIKLLAKEAEHRYQSARGLAHDLNLCLSSPHVAIELGANDIARSFMIPARVYGREAEVAMLTDAFARARNSESIIVKVTGPSGIGKSALVHELVRNCAANGGFLASGKFEQNIRNAPFLALTQALKPLVSSLLSLDNARLEAWRQKITKALGDNGQVVADLVPELSLLMGPLPPIAPLAPLEAMNRLNLAFENFLCCFADPGRPLVLFLDDLQWADGASLRLLEVLGSKTGDQSLLLIFAYRDEEVGEGHPLHITLNRLREREVQIVRLDLRPLGLEAVTSLVADTLHCDTLNAAPLARLITKKSAGNPFFIVKLLHLIHERGTIKFDANNRRFVYDPEALATIPIAENVIEVVLAELRRLDDSCRSALAHAALIGREFSLMSLAGVLEVDGPQLGKVLGPAINADILIPIDSEYRLLATAEADIDVRFRFAHDRVQETARHLLAHHELTRAHLRVGRFLARAQEPRLLIEATGHLSAAIDLLAEEERLDLAKLCLKAGNLVAKGAAYHPAYEAFELGLRALGSQPWDEDYQTALQLHVRLIEVAYHADQSEKLEILFRNLISSAKKSDALAISPAYSAMCQALSEAARYKEAIQIGCQGLAMLGDNLNEHPSSFRVFFDTLRTMITFNTREIAKLRTLPELKDPTQIAIRSLSADIGMAAAFVNKNLVALLIMRGVRQTLKYGMTEPSNHSIASYALVLAGTFRRFDQADAMMQALIETSRERGYTKTYLRTSFFYHSILRTWSEIPREGIQTLEQLLGSFISNGDLEFAGHAVVSLLARKSLAENLDHLLQSAPGYYFTLKRYRQEQMALYFGIYCLFLSELTEKPCGIPLPAITDDEAMQRVLEHQSAMVRNGYHMCRYMLFTILGRYEESVQEYKKASSFEWSTSWLGYGFVYNRTYASIARFAAMTRQTFSRMATLKMRPFLNLVKILAKRSPLYYGFSHHILGAEMARLRGQDALALREYQEARKWSTESGISSLQALAYERSGRYSLTLGDQYSGLAYLRKARNLFATSGSRAKVALLDAEFSALKSPEIATSIKNKITATYSNLGEALDIESICRACQAISSELTIESLIQSLAKITLEAAGARRGLILIKEGPILVSHISATLTSEFSADLRPRQLDTLNEELAISVVNLALRMQQTVVLDDAKQDPKFATDPYIVKSQCASIACIPIENQGDLVGILYLENDLSKGVFNAGRMKTLSLIAAQGAISIRNVQHLTTAKEKVRLEGQMRAAQAVQNSLLPPTGAIPGVGISAAYISADETGGDWYGYYHERTNDWLYVQIGDVTGHGVPAALVTGAVCGAISSAYDLLPRGAANSPEQCLEVIVRAANRAVTTAGVRSDHLMTMAFLVIDLRTGDGLYHNAGHVPILLKRGNKAEILVARGNPLGLVDSVEFVRFSFNPGDLLLLITDGLIENGPGQNIKRRRNEIKKILEQATNEEDLKDLVLQNYQHHLQNSRAQDDCSLLGIQRRMLP